ncbi:MAG: hypothetical protein IT502_07675 [Rubrivivax sp.]|jgi:hypothetical protein|nr:hypothetical protein [Rubrivivax sp.]
MDANSGKKLFASYEDADRAAKAMRTRHDEPFRPVKVEGGWVVGGRHLKRLAPYKRVKAFADIPALFAELADSVSENDVAEYANQIRAENAPSEVIGEGERWKLISADVQIGKQLGMKSDKPYLVLTLTREAQTLRIQMGGAFSRHIPLIARQAESLLGRNIIWYTWNPSNDPTKWENNKWFYMIEPVDA